MKYNAKSSITLPAPELALVKRLKKELRLKSNVEVIRRSLQLLQETRERESLREQYREASAKVRASTDKELQELDHLAAEGLE